MYLHRLFSSFYPFLSYACSPSRYTDICRLEFWQFNFETSTRTATRFFVRSLSLRSFFTSPRHYLRLLLSISRSLFARLTPSFPSFGTRLETAIKGLNDFLFPLPVTRLRPRDNPVTMAEPRMEADFTMAGAVIGN